MTGNQLRAAREFLGWSAKKLAEISGVSWATIQRYEAWDREVVPNYQKRDCLKLTLQANGIVFADDKTDWLGVWLMFPR